MAAASQIGLGPKPWRCAARSRGRLRPQSPDGGGADVDLEPQESVAHKVGRDLRQHAKEHALQPGGAGGGEAFDWFKVSVLRHLGKEHSARLPYGSRWRSSQAPARRRTKISTRAITISGTARMMSEIRRKRGIRPWPDRVPSRASARPPKAPIRVEIRDIDRRSARESIWRRALAGRRVSPTLPREHRPDRRRCCLYRPRNRPRSGRRRR